MGIVRLFILSLLLAVIGPAFSLADDAAPAANGKMSLPAQSSAAPQSDLEKMLNKPAPGEIPDMPPEAELVPRGPSHLSDSIQNAMIHMEQQKLAMYQQNLDSLEGIRRSDIAAYADAKDQAQKDSTLEAKKITDQKIAYVNDQIKKCQARLRRLQAGPMTAQDLRELALLY